MSIRTLLTALTLASTVPLVGLTGIHVQSAHAGHYRLPIADFITETETAAFVKAGITTTLALLDAVSTSAKRTDLARRTGLTRERIDSLSGQVDLLRVEGIGPSVVRLLSACEIRDTRGLGNAQAGALHARMLSTNASTRILGAMPPEPLVASWIARARALPQVLQDLR